MSIQSTAERGLTWLINPVEALLTHRYQYDDTVLSNQAHIKLAADWLLRSQAVSKDGGYSRKYNLVLKKWDKSYIETTGYIIPTLFATAKFLKDDCYRESAVRAVEFLMGKQTQSGAFCDIDSETPHVFDTGQCLMGLLSANRELSDKRILEAAIRAGKWLMESQASEGCWINGSYLNQPHSYYSRVAAALMELGKITADEQFVSAGVRHIEWVLKQQKENGFFQLCGFDEQTPPYLHTMIYVLEGLLKCHELVGMEKALESALKNARKLAEINFNREILLSAQYQEDYSVYENSRCVTGLCQWTGVCVDLYQITGEKAWLDLAQRTGVYLKARQLKEGDNLCGGLTGSIPVHGSYAPNTLPNWNAKFFIDMLIKLDQVSADPVSKQLEHWVTASFSFFRSVVSNQLCAVDKNYLGLVTEKLNQLDLTHFRMVDVGCGRGKFVQQLQHDFPEMECFGIDPFFYQEIEAVQNGSVTDTGLSDQAVNAVLCVEVLQHAVELKAALNEFHRVLKKDGILFICDRNPVSVLGCLKPYKERQGKWMYCADSPFKERWYANREWRQALDNAGFLIESFYTVNNPDDKIKYWNRYHVIIARAV